MALSTKNSGVLVPTDQRKAPAQRRAATRRR